MFATGRQDCACLMRLAWARHVRPAPWEVQVRQLMGMDAGSGALMIGDVVRVGQRLRFVVRDR